MNKLWITLICVFLAVLIIGCVIYPESDMQGTIDLIKSDFSPIFTAFGYASDIVKGIISFGEIFDKEGNAEAVDSLVSQNTGIYNNLSLYIPYHLNKYNLVDRCSDQSWNIFVAQNELHTDHKICVLLCYLDSEKNIFGNVNKDKAMSIGYCGICEKIIFIFARINNSGNKYLYPYEKAGASVEYISVPWVANEFLYDEVTDYLTNLYN